MQYSSRPLWTVIVLLLLIIPLDSSAGYCPVCQCETSPAPGDCENQQCILGSDDPEEEESRENIRRRVQRDYRRTWGQIFDGILSQVSNALLPIPLRNWESELEKLRVKLIKKQNWNDIGIDINRVLSELEYQQAHPEIYPVPEVVDTTPQPENTQVTAPEWITGMQIWSTNGDPNECPNLDNTDQTMRRSGYTVSTINPNQGQDVIEFVKELLRVCSQKLLLIYSFGIDGENMEQYYLIEVDSQGQIFSFADIEDLEGVQHFNNPEDFVAESIVDFDPDSGDSVTIHAYFLDERRRQRDSRAPEPK
ncbi:hypothetical protein [Endozoicomonas arenosclerae]|uniref:hypothetical protein n=1 Tax=Endozoicomonas arenosclerae TaxID=1633495 RepID=UPI00078189C2|nr:hypothetical protein [Endozoicomonas arenosclerae]